MAAILILIACTLLGYAIVIPRGSGPSIDAVKLFGIVSAVSLVVGVVVFVSWTTVVLSRGPDVSWPTMALAMGIVVLAAIGVFAFPAHARWIYTFFLVSFFVVQVMVIVSRTSTVDVWYFQAESAKALIAGTNPFALRFPDLFSGPIGEPLYGPGVSVDGVLQFGYPYPPLSLLVILPFQAVLADFRMGIALAYVVTAWMIGRLGEAGVGRRVAVLSLLVAPVTVIDTVGFSEPAVAMFGVAVILVHHRRKQLSPYALGAFLAVKQYTIIAMPLYLLLMPRPWDRRSVARVLVKATAVFTVFLVPFLLWNPEALTRSVYLLQLRQPLRLDAITFTAQFIAPYVHLSSLALAALPLTAAAIAIVLSLKYAPVGIQGYALGSAFTFAMFFEFAKQASMPNYYVVVIAFCFAAAATFTSRTDESTSVAGTHEASVISSG